MKKKILTFVMALALLLSLCTPFALAEDGPAFDYSIEVTKNGGVIQNVSLVADEDQIEATINPSEISVDDVITVTVTMTRTDIADGETYTPYGLEMDIGNVDAGMTFVTGTYSGWLYNGSTESPHSTYSVGSVSGLGTIRYFKIGSPSATFTLAKTVSVSASYKIQDTSKAVAIAVAPLIYLNNDEYTATPSTKVTLTLDTNGGSFASSTDDVSGEYDPNTVVTLPTPVRNGYTFMKWREDSAAAVVEYDPGSYTVTKTVTLKAIWGVEYIYDPNGGEVTIGDTTSSQPVTVTLEEGVSMVTPTASRNGYTFIEWKADNTNPNKFVAQWGGKITFYPGESGTYNGEANPVTAASGTAITLSDAAWDGNTFMGWTDGTTDYAYPGTYTVDGNVTLTAKWGGQITLQPGTGASFSSDDPDISGTYANGIQLTLPTPVKDGYTFQGWMEATGGTVAGPYTVSGNATLTASWEGNSVTIAYDAGEGTVAQGATTNAKVGDQITMPGATRTGYTLTGWKTSGDQNNYVAGSSYTVPAVATGTTITFTAVWEGDAVTIIIEPNGGTAEGHSDTYTVTGYKVGQKYTLPAATRDKCIFNGWAVATNAAQLLPAGFEYPLTTTRVNFVADWAPDENENNIDDRTEYRTIRYTDGVDGTVVFEDETFTQALDGLATPAFEGTPFRNGYQWRGWNPAVKETVSGDQTYTAKWGGRITLQPGEGAGFSSPDQDISGIYDNGTSLALPTPVKDGYTFKGWIDVAGAPVSSPLTVDGDITLKGTWEGKSVTIAYNAAGGSVTGTPATSAKVGDTITLPGAERTGYTLTNWSYNNSTYNAGSEFVIPVSAANGTITFTANWAGNPVTLRLDANGGKFGDETASKDISTYVGASVTLADEPTRVGYTFAGWKDEGNSTVTSPYTVPAPTTATAAIVTLTAQWTPKEVTVQFSPNGGTVSPRSMSGKVGASITLPIPTNDEGITFSGWSDGTAIYNGSYTIPETDEITITLTAVWGTTVTFNLNGGSFAQGVTDPSGSYQVGNKITMPGASLPDTTFAGWRLGTSNSIYQAGYEYTVTGAAIFNAVYTASIDFANIDGAALNPATNPVTGEVGTKITLPNATKTGSTLVGWQRGSDAGDGTVYKAGAEYTVSKNETLYAVWGGTITLVPGTGATVSGDNPIVAANGEKIDLPTPVNSGKTFIGWYDGDTPAALDDSGKYTVDGDATLTAKWGGTITLDPGEGTLPEGAQNPIVAADGENISLPVPSNTNDHVFLGWSDGTDTYGPNDQYAVNGNDALTAVWGATITLDPDPEVQGDETAIVKPIGDETKLPAPDGRDGYTFIGWKDEDGNVYGPNDNYKVEDNETLTAVWGATVTYDPAGGSVNPASEVKASGETVTLPTPTRSGYTFKGWDLNGQTYQAGDQYTVDGDVTFTAQWEQNNDLPPYVPDNPPAPAEPDVIVIPVDPDVDADGSGEKNDDGTITITVKDGNGEPLDPVPGGIFVQVKNAEDGDVVVIIDPETGEILDLVEKSLVENGNAYALLDGPATIKIIRNAKPFDDVDDGDWFDGAVKFVSSHELFLGITEDLFAPGYEMTRGMLVTVLWRLENRPEAVGTMAFDDVAEGAYYAEAVNWASENGLVNGYGDGTFRPNRSITREEMAALLHRYMNYLGYEFTPVDSLDAFSDGDTVSAWAVNDVKWAVGAGMIAGRPDGTIDPQGTANRAEVATMFMRFISAMVKSHAV